MGYHPVRGRGLGTPKMTLFGVTFGSIRGSNIGKTVLETDPFWVSGHTPRHYPTERLTPF